MQDRGGGGIGWAVGWSSLGALTAGSTGPLASARIDAAGFVFFTLLSVFGYVTFATRVVYRWRAR